MRVKCIVSYDGSKFHGFQVQNKERTVQGEIQKALKKINEEDVIIHASGRTDAKVHAVHQVFHFDTKEDFYQNMGQILNENDTILVKASHFMEFPEIVKKLSEEA